MGNCSVLCNAICALAAQVHFRLKLNSHLVSWLRLCVFARFEITTNQIALIHISYLYYIVLHLHRTRIYFIFHHSCVCAFYSILFSLSPLNRARELKLASVLRRFIPFAAATDVTV